MLPEVGKVPYLYSKNSVSDYISHQTLWGPEGSRIIFLMWRKRTVNSECNLHRLHISFKNGGGISTCVSEGKAREFVPSPSSPKEWLKEIL